MKIKKIKQSEVCKSDMATFEWYVTLKGVVSDLWQPNERKIISYTDSVTGGKGVYRNAQDSVTYIPNAAHEASLGRKIKIIRAVLTFFSSRKNCCNFQWNFKISSHFVCRDYKVILNSYLMLLKARSLKSLNTWKFWLPTQHENIIISWKAELSV